MDRNIIILVLLLLLAAGAYFYFKFQKKKEAANSNKAQISEKTAQDFINVLDLGDDVLYTVDGMVYCYVCIDGICLELFSDNDLMDKSKNLAAELAKIRRPWKLLSVSRPLDLKGTLQVYAEIYSEADENQKILLKQEMKELAEMANKGDTLERKHYAVIYGKLSEERAVRETAQELAGIFSKNSVGAHLMGKQGIAELCNLVNIPAYSHIENRYDFDETILEAIIK